MSDLPLFDLVTESPPCAMHAARAARDEAMSRVESHTPDTWKAGALDAIRRLAETEATIHPDDAREAITNAVGEPHEWRVLGPLLTRAVNEGWLSRTPIRRMSRLATNHGHERYLYRSRLYRPNAFEREGRERKARAMARALFRLDRDLPGRGSAEPLSERVAAMAPDFWQGLARVAGRDHASDATIARVIEILHDQEASAAA